MPGYGTRYGVLDYGQEIERYGVNDISVIHLNENTIRINFQANMVLSNELLAASTYMIMPINSGAVTVQILAVVNTSNSPNPIFVDLIVSELTGEDGSDDYQLSFPSGLLESVSGGPIISPNNTVNFEATPFRPYVVDAWAIDLNTVDLEFNESMENNDCFRDPNSYQFTGGLIARAISVISNNKVRIYVTPAMATDQSYIVTVGE